MNYLFVFIGGGAGCMARLFVSSVFQQNGLSLPLGTFVSNVVSSLLLGVLVGYMFQKGMANESLRLFAAVGFCGGFSTFSTFSLETFNLMSSGNWKYAIGNVLANILICFAAVVAGFWLGRSV